MNYVTNTIGGISEKISTGKTPSTKEPRYFDEDINWFTPGDFKGIRLINSRRFISHLAIEEKKATLFGKGTVLLSCIGDIGKVGVLVSDSSCNQQITSIKLKEIVDPFFFAYWCRANKKMIESKASNAVVPILNNATLSRIKITYPQALLDQKRISHLLGKVESLINERKQSLEQLDELLKSVFWDMFGDPVRNEKVWDKLPLKVFGKISTGNTPPRKDSDNYSENHVEWIKTDNIPSNSAYINNAAEYLSEKGVKKGRTVSKGALLVACIAGSIQSIGRAALTNRKVAFNQQINAIQPNSEVNPFYLYVLFLVSKAYIQSHASKGMKRIITKGDFEKISFIKPPIELQNQFSIKAEKIEKIKRQYQSSLSDLEELYNALSQKAFKGELDLSRINLTDEVVESFSFDKLQQSIEVIDRLVPRPISRINEIMNYMIPPSIQRTQQLIKALNPIPDNIQKLYQWNAELNKESLGPFSHLDLFGFKDLKSRPKILEHWFNEWLSLQEKGNELILKRFWARAQISLVDYLYEEDLEEFEFSVEDYGVVKGLLFQAIDNGSIKQKTDTVQLKDENVAGNRVVLVKG